VMWSAFLGVMMMGLLQNCFGVSQDFVLDEQGFDGAVNVLESEEKEGTWAVTVQIPYRDMRGEVKTGQGRLFVRQKDIEQHKPLPLFCHVHYEKDFGGANRWCRQGWVVVTPHYTGPEGGAPIDASPANSENQSRALIQWARRLPFVDRTRLHIDGGSQGGYMALAMAAEFFPVRSVTADAPVLNWAYNLSYFEVNKPVSKYPVADIRQSPLPVMCSVTMLADWCYKYFGSDLASDTWYRLSPISFVSWITSPVQMMCATGDMLVPIGQVDRKLQRPLDGMGFPEGFQIDFDALTRVPSARKTLVECLPPERVWLRVQPLQEGATEITLAHFLKEEKEPPAPPKQDRPWSRDHQWSILVLEEGPPAPYSPHTRYRWSFPPDQFVNAHRDIPPSVDLLTAPKLDRLIQRYTGKMENLPILADGTTANRHNFAQLEQLDVLTGLLDYAEMGPQYEERLVALYVEARQQPFGPSLQVDKLKSMRNELLGQLGLSPDMNKTDESSPR